MDHNSGTICPDQWRNCGTTDLMSFNVINPYQTFTDSTGAVRAGGFLKFFENGTTTKASIFSDEALTVAQTNPYTLDSNGQVQADVKYAGLLTVQESNINGSDVKITDNVATMSATDTTVGIRVDSMEDLIALNPDAHQLATMLSFHDGVDKGSGPFYWNAIEDIANHNGITIIDPSNTADISVWDVTEQTTWFTASSGSLGCWIRIFDGNLNLDWAGTEGISSSDATLSVANMFTLATNTGSGTFKGANIDVPSGDYAMTQLDFSITDESVENQEWIGAGGETGDASTRWIFSPASSGTGLLLKSLINFRFANIEFIAGNSNCTEVILMHAFDEPVFSTYLTTFDKCSFRPLSTQTVSIALVNMKNTAQTVFNHCWWSGDQNSIRLGENAGVDSGTFGNGAVGNITFNNCYISTDILVRSSINTSFNSCEFGRNGTTLVPARIIPEGDENQRNTAIRDCTQVSINAAGTGTFYTQGITGFGLYAVNNRIKSYAINFLIDSGNCIIKNNTIQDMGSAQIGIQLGTNATECEITPNNFSDLIANGRTPIDDNRSSPRWPLIVDATLSSAYTFTATGVFEDILASSATTHNGGLLRIRWAAFLNTAAATTFTFRFVIDGVLVQKLSDRAVVVSGGDRQFYGEAIISLNKETTGVIFKLTGNQSSGTLSVIEAQGTSFSTFIQVEEL